MYGGLIALGVGIVLTYVTWGSWWVALWLAVLLLGMFGVLGYLSEKST